MLFNYAFGPVWYEKGGGDQHMFLLLLAFKNKIKESVKNEWV